MISTLYVAAGGGGDAIAAAILANRARTPAAIATYAWDRLIIDPLPGPRGAQDFEDLVEHAPSVWEITSRTTPRPPAGSTLPRLARELSARLFLLDPYGGAVGMAEQLKATAQLLGAGSLVLVDMGGDLVANGDEPELRSPLADALALAACELVGLPFHAIVAGPGLDGELSEQQVLMRCGSGQSLPPLTAPEAEVYASVFRWHPSEATGLWTAAARGHRGTVEIRDAGLPITLTGTSAHMCRVDDLSNVFSDKLRETTSLQAVEDVIRAVRGSTELDYERRKADRRTENPLPTEAAVAERIAEVERATSADYLTVRRLSELISFPAKQFEQLTAFLSAHSPQRLAAPLWRVREQHQHKLG